MTAEARAQIFRYEGWTWTPGASGGELTCSYSLDRHRFKERIFFEGAPDEPGPELSAALRMVFLLAGISYYKAGAPPIVDLGKHSVTDLEREFLRTYYVRGLGEFAFKLGMLHELQDLEIEGPRRPPQPVTASSSSDSVGPLVPFGGGIDSIVVVEETRAQHSDLALFIASRTNARFEAIETAARATGLPIRRADRELDPQILRSAELGFLNGHVPVTGILSAMAVATALVDGRTSVVMSNEWSASSGNVDVGGIPVNHQWSKSIEFEKLFRAVLAENLQGFDYYSALRPYSELWVAQRFAALEQYHMAFRSCNRAFHLDPARRWDRWCGRCDKCCFIDLILSPFMDADRLRQIFSGQEPLDQVDLEQRFLSLLGDPELAKPFECVGDVDECRAAVNLCAERPDRQGGALLERLVSYVRRGPVPPKKEDLLRPLSETFSPEFR